MDIQSCYELARDSEILRFLKFCIINGSLTEIFKILHHKWKFKEVYDSIFLVSLLVWILFTDIKLVMEYLPTNLLVKSIGSISKSFIGQSFDVVYQGQRKVLKTGGAH